MNIFPFFQCAESALWSMRPNHNDRDDDDGATEATRDLEVIAVGVSSENVRRVAGKLKVKLNPI